MTQRAALVLVLGALTLPACGDGDDEDPETAAAPPAAESPQEKPRDRPEPAGESRDAGDEGADPEAAVARQVRRYVSGLSEGDGAVVCSILSAGALDAVKLPRERAGCGPSLTASIGYRDPRGLPVFERARVAGAPAISLDGESARATATIITTFADRDEPSIEDDVIYLTEDDGRWLIAKPSAVLYRAVGIADIPPQVLAPP